MKYKCESCGAEFDYLGYKQVSPYRIIEVFRKKWGEDVGIRGPLGNYFVPMCPYCLDELNRSSEEEA